MRHPLMLVAASITLTAACADEPPEVAPPTTEFLLRIENVAPWRVLKGDVLASASPGTTGPLGPGQAYELSFTAGQDQSINFATMLSESNDWFFAPGPDGIPLYDKHGVPMSGDLTRYVVLWNAGTELDQEPAVGDATGPRQPRPDFGERDPNPNIRGVGRLTHLSDGRLFERPDIVSMIRVVLVPDGDRRFTLRIENVSTAQTLVTSAGPRAVHLSPVVWALQILSAPLFEPGTVDRRLGLEQLVEDGNPGPLGEWVRVSAGYHTALSPGVIVVHRVGSPLFTIGSPDLGMGLERLAEDGDNRTVAFAIEDEISFAFPVVSVGTFDAPIGRAPPAAAQPGEAFEVVFTAEPGDRLSFVTMFGMSNDWFFAPRPDGLALFDRDRPIAADVTDQIRLYDLGTEVDEELAIGRDTGIQQPGPDVGPPDPVRKVREVTFDRYDEPISKHVNVTITPRIIVVAR